MVGWRFFFPEPVDNLRMNLETWVCIASPGTVDALLSFAAPMLLLGMNMRAMAACIR